MFVRAYSNFTHTRLHCTCTRKRQRVHDITAERFVQKMARADLASKAKFEDPPVRKLQFYSLASLMPSGLIANMASASGKHGES